MIGVNDQYRGRSVEKYTTEFESLLKKAIQFAGNGANHVVVLSIPDWGVTPFAIGSRQRTDSKEIDAYNAANKEIALQYKVHYIDITPWTREAARIIPCWLLMDYILPLKNIGAGQKELFSIFGSKL